MAEKRTPHYSLEEVQAAFSTAEGLRMTKSALEGALEVGYDSEDVVNVIRSMKRSQFHESTTSCDDQEVWQDAYHVPSFRGMLYVTFTVEPSGGFMLLSF